MSAVFFLLPAAVALGAVFVILFLGAARDGQFDDLDDPAVRILRDDQGKAAAPPTPRARQPSSPA
ncbi:MAG: cbb3-type cytochrome oxidase assembly protein CcoS [Deltaproteobacteria bacterium]|nr:cbb3-type cytochrome oxidase assembly protein CcoS [Deltaproteobacteria bacterium]